MTFCLESTFLEPENGNEIKNAIILLHGYGGDGKDISSLSLNWKRHLPNTVFCCPNGPEKCFINPSGFQWFDLTKEDKNYIIEQSKKSEIKLIKFIDEIKEKFKLENNKICLSGFSQGCMMSLNVGLTNPEQFNCIIGFSGKIIDQDDLLKRKKNSTDIILFHGDQDEIVSPSFLLEAKDFFLRNNNKIETHLLKNCGHHIPIEASSLALNYILKKFNI